MLKTFPVGGIHPPENKFTAKSEIRALQIPECVTIPVSQHIGAPATLVVAKGEYVKTGQLIAVSKGYVSANIHSSVSGIINRIDKVIDTTGYKQEAVIIDVEGDEWIESIDRSNSVDHDIYLSPGEIIQKCRESGIVGLGGASFPSHVKLSIPDGKKCDILVINGAECEPYLTSDHRLMLERGEEIIIGIRILMKALNVTSAKIGIESNKPDAIENLSLLASGIQGITIHPLKVKYPQGAEKQLLKTLLNREVSSGSLPIDIGAVVHNIGTAYAVYEAVQKNKPLFERVVTVSGKSLSEPGNFITRIGTPVSNLIEAAGGMPIDTLKIISGGPMMGKALNNKNIPVVKGTSGIIVLPVNESVKLKNSPCIKCAKCVSVCALGLEPYLLMQLSEKELYERAEKERIRSCMECGSCTYVCPAGRPLLDFIRLGKSTAVKMINIQQPKPQDN